MSCEKEEYFPMPGNLVNPLPLSDRQAATLLAALRYWQRKGLTSGGREQDIASDEGNCEPLSSAEIDVLCESIRASEAG
jgi:hypothetical protein